MATRDGDGATPLHFAASRGHLSVVKWLVFHGAKADEKDDCGKTPLDDAVENSHADVVELLSASAGATTASARRSVCALTDDEGRSPLAAPMQFFKSRNINFPQDELELVSVQRLLLRLNSNLF